MSKKQRAHKSVENQSEKRNGRRF